MAYKNVISTKKFNLWTLPSDKTRNYIYIDIYKYHERLSVSSQIHVPYVAVLTENFSALLEKQSFHIVVCGTRPAGNIAS